MYVLELIKRIFIHPGHQEIVELLVKYCANIDIKDKNGRTARDWASNEGIVNLGITYSNFI